MSADTPEQVQQDADEAARLVTYLDGRFTNAERVELGAYAVTQLNRCNSTSDIEQTLGPLSDGVVADMVLNLAVMKEFITVSLRVVLDHSARRFAASNRTKKETTP